MNHADVAARFLRDALEAGPDCVLLAGPYAVLDRSGESDLLPLYQSRAPGGRSGHDEALETVRHRQRRPRTEARSTAV
ncbi:hypothetical protein KZZ52_33650 [Dactylosporangium sp. AC04546]|uniref:hypothetical protein n=1 Tax=Dactylosporangium sp. AC04546 TaxID=2862460 RepID=UPI001EDD21AE|nr:hypothetical protein [Dactylosporangium sp. AC04546]WVK78921.1 hypothetical protein KZZ52_33650 [Dactylosporangium sp. AC04546]